MTRILITGAAGRIGSRAARYLASRYELVLTDVRPFTNSLGLPAVIGDIADPAHVAHIMQGVDIVLHLAAQANPEAAWEDLLSPNVIGAHTLFAAAAQAGCRRVIFASSVHAVMGHPADVQVQTTMPPRPLDLYGATKIWGEALARYYADQHHLSTICLRIGWVLDRADAHIRLATERWDGARSPADDDLDIVITFDDLMRLFQASIDAPDDLRFGIFHGVSHNRWKRLDISDARTVLGYEPLDDAFAMALTREFELVSTK